MLVEVVAADAEGSRRLVGAERESSGRRSTLLARTAALSRRLSRWLKADHLEFQLLRRDTRHPRSGKDRAQIARWERDLVQPSFETLRELVRACGLDLAPALVPYEVDEDGETRLREKLFRSPQDRLQAMLEGQRQ